VLLSRAVGVGERLPLADGESETLSGVGDCTIASGSVRSCHRRTPSEGPRDQGHPISSDGVDISLIRWMLSLTPRERILVLQSNAQSHLIEFKMELDRERDRAVLPILRRTLEERDRNSL
jgi:hypothetical protein